jgi:hypothetical protein
VCVGASNMTTASDDPSSSDPCVVCTGFFPRGGPRGGGGGGRYAPPGYAQCSGQHLDFFFGQFLLFLVVL